MSNLEILIESAVELGSAKAMVALGLSAGEISQRRARDIYGKYFLDAVKSERIRPCRIEEGRCGTKFYRIEDILKLKVIDSATNIKPF